MDDITPDGNRPVSVALALLDRQWPSGPPLVDSTGADDDRAGAVVALESDPRYLIGRFQQALTALLTTDLPPMDDTTSLLSQAIIDAISWRRHDGRPCDQCPGPFVTAVSREPLRPRVLPPGLCEACNADGNQADRYHALARAIGAVGEARAS
jgi:hypothetical protein